ncbi:uronyl 2-sulfotransferase-like [Sitophilus oryzae]|uniref:Uronyl 2-sulfotransferase-like n=1 Tax=Sitophilus oryzae TaxID=7048 RepID=A0A6J2YUJ7_SITOR|nr:uronyl 2-sulfotransferase-like [Sitophilus oryzae]
MIRRRRLKTQLYLIIIFAIVSGGILYSNIKLNRETYNSDVINFNLNNLPKKALLSVRNTPNSSSTTEVYYAPSSSTKKKYVTKSMNELGKMDEINKYFLFLNWMTGSGAEMLVFLLEKIQGMNSFKHVRLKGKQILSSHQQETLIDDMNEIRRSMAVPLSFDRNVYFVNFTFFERQSPTYLGLVRHPIAKVVSQSIWRNNTDIAECLLKNQNNCTSKIDSKNFTIPWFCGFDPRCMIINSDWALKQAKENVNRFYPVVGVLEQFDNTLKVLEHKLPQFFKGANNIFNATLIDIFKNKKEPEISKSMENTLREPLKNELEFYIWIKKRLENQIMDIET